MKNTKSNTKTSLLMKTILVERYRDIDILEQLCKELLEISNRNHDMYGISFANLYLFDVFSVRGDYEEARVYLLRTQSLCEKYDFQDLLMIFHNLAGLYYQDLFDEHSAIQHYLAGLKLAKRLNNTTTESKIYNNFGICFRRRYDNEAALYYFNAACETIESKLSEEECQTTISFLCNAAEVYQAMNKIEESKATLKKAQELYINNQCSYYQLKCAWCGHYAISGEKEKSIALAKELIEEGLNEFSLIQLVLGIYFEIFDYMLFIDCKEMAYQYLLYLESSCSYKNIGEYYNYNIRKIRYYERYGTCSECFPVYEEFYNTSLKLNEVDDTLRVENILAKIELKQALFDIKIMKKENEKLENVSYIDELTKLYNRRYLLNLTKNIFMSEEKVDLGFAMIDVDYFKEYNDFYGHGKGDDALRCVGNILKSYERKDIYASRYGGDEFLVLFVNYTTEQMIDYIINIQNSLNSCSVSHEKSKTASQLTLSIGLSNGYAANETILDNILKCADQALYQAKEDGRNCFVYKASN